MEAQREDSTTSEGVPPATISLEGLSREAVASLVFFFLQVGGVDAGERHAAAEAYVREVFPAPLHPDRWRELQAQWGVTREQVYATAADVLLEIGWLEAKREPIPAGEFRRRLGAALNRLVPELLLGDGWRERSNQADAVRLDALPPEQALPLLEGVHGTAASPEDLLLAEERRQEAEERLAVLSQAQRECWELSELDGLTSAEIAERTGRKASTVRVHLHRARTKLRAAL